MEGRVDPTFSLLGPGFDSDVLALVLQPDGKIIAGGRFTSYNDGTAAYVCGGIARINPNGTFDTTFVNGLSRGFGALGVVYELALQPDGKIIVCGEFTAYNDGINVYNCSHIARLNSDGTFDAGFENGPSIGFGGTFGTFSLVLQPDGKIVVGGNFTSYTDTTDIYFCNNIARLNTDGTFDTSFVYGGSNGFNGSVLSLVLQPDGKIIAGGQFLIYVVGMDFYSCNRIARLNTDGTFDTAFANGSGIGFDGGFTVFTLALQPNGKIVVGGNFTSHTDGVGTYVCNNIARLNTNGTFDTSFVNGVGTGFEGGFIVSSLTLLPNKKIIVGGNFTTYKDGSDHDCNYIARLKEYGYFDSTFVNGPGKNFGASLFTNVYSMALYRNGRLVTGGNFISYFDDVYHACGGIIRLIAYKPIAFSGENFGMASNLNVNAANVSSSLTLPISSDPGVTPGSVCIGPSGGLLIRKVDGRIGTIA